MQEFTLKSWMLTESKNTIAYGKVFNNPCFIDGDYIHTSLIKEITIDSNRSAFVTKTKSNSTYLLPFNAMSLGYKDINKTQLEALLGQSVDDIWETILTQSEETIKKERAALMARIDDFHKKSEKGSLYLEFVGNELNEEPYFHRQDVEEDIPEIYVVKKSVHVGMFQDSVLITDWEHGLVDYRYFPHGDSGIETYHWSDGLNSIWVNNTGNRHIDFDGTIVPAKTCAIIKKGNQREGLISPDAVNGKSLLTDKGD